MEKRAKRKFNLWNMYKGQHIQRTKEKKDRKEILPSWFIDMCKQYIDGTLVKPLSELPMEDSGYERRRRKQKLKYNNILMKMKRSRYGKSGEVVDLPEGFKP